MVRKQKFIRYFHGDIELERVGNYLITEIQSSKTYGFATDRTGPRQLAGFEMREKGAPIELKHLVLHPVERKITVIKDGNPHECDWRCEGASKTSECRCSCQGKNHGRKNITCVGF